MAEVNVAFPAEVTVGEKKPTLERKEVYLKEGETFISDTYKVTVPMGKYAKVIVKCIVHEITEDEYNAATAPEAQGV